MPRPTIDAVYTGLFSRVPDPLMQLMDCPDASQHAPKRESSVTALQALGMLNNRFWSAKVSAWPSGSNDDPTPEAQVWRLFELAYHRTWVRRSPLGFAARSRTRQPTPVVWCSTAVSFFL